MHILLKLHLTRFFFILLNNLSLGFLFKAFNLKKSFKVLNISLLDSFVAEYRSQTIGSLFTLKHLSDDMIRVRLTKNSIVTDLLNAKSIIMNIIF